MLTLIPCVTIQRMEAAVKDLGHGDSVFENKISALTLEGRLSVADICILLMFINFGVKLV